MIILASQESVPSSIKIRKQSNLLIQVSLFPVVPVSLISVERNARKSDGVKSSGDYRKLQQLALILIHVQTTSSLFLCGVSQMR